MRWNDTIILLASDESYQDDEGGWHEGVRREREVFCNHGILGTMVDAQLRSSEVRITSGEAAPQVGLRKMHRVYVKEIDYEDESQVIFHGREMDVISATSEGDNMNLIISERLGND